jgi:hypothetical protein
MAVDQVKDLQARFWKGKTWRPPLCPAILLRNLNCVCQQEQGSGAYKSYQADVILEDIRDRPRLQWKWITSNFPS